MKNEAPEKINVVFPPNDIDFSATGRGYNYIHEDVVANMVAAGIMTYEAWKETQE